jgi:predicted metal-dependent hydrolase
MKLATRDLLAELLVEALADPIAAEAIRCLATYCHTDRIALPVTVDSLLQPVPATRRERVVWLLQQSAFLTWDPPDGSGQVSLASEFIPEQAEVVAKLSQYGAALEEWVPDETASDLTTALRKGVLLFNHHLFFEVHEILEAQWVTEVGEEKRFLQGLIQIAVAFYHLGNSNLRGTLSLLQDGLEKIAPHQPAFLGIELRDFVAGLEACQKELQQLGQLRTTRIPQMRLIG